LRSVSADETDGGEEEDEEQRSRGEEGRGGETGDQVWLLSGQDSLV